MKSTSHKSIYLTREEVKRSIAGYLVENYETELAEHLCNNGWEGDWSQDGKEFIVIIDGALDDNIDDKIKVLSAENDQLRHKLSLLEAQSSLFKNRCACYFNNLKMCENDSNDCNNNDSVEGEQNV
jgi:hypothetical protein